MNSANINTKNQKYLKIFCPEYSRTINENNPNLNGLNVSLKRQIFWSSSPSWITGCPPGEEMIVAPMLGEAGGGNTIVYRQSSNGKIGLHTNAEPSGYFVIGCLLEYDTVPCGRYVL
jgi:hypothetical protein